jgi:hypothetical protein
MHAEPKDACMAKSFPDVQGTQNWQDITALASHAAIANERVTIQAKNGAFNYVYFGGAVAPAANAGVILPVIASVSGTSDHIWVRGDARFAVLVED